MLVGSCSVVGEDAPTIASWRTDPIVLEHVTCIQVIAEMRRAHRAEMLPPGLHPTDPPTLSIQGWDVARSPWGGFQTVFSRVSCRSGLRARGLTTAMAVSTKSACLGLIEAFGFPARVSDVRVRSHYDACEIDVDESLRVRAVDPRPLGVDDVQYTGTMNLAHTPNGLRLVQVETEHDAVSVHRLRARIERFDALPWGDARLSPYDVVAATVSVERSITIPAIRFACRPDVSAFEGTEKIR